MSNTIIGSITSKQNLTGEISKAIEYLDPITQEKETIPTKETQIITYDKGYTGLSKLTVGPIPEEYIIPDGTKEIGENGEIDVSAYKTANVNVNPSLQDKSITITESGTQNITADEGYDGLNNVEVITNIESMPVINGAKSLVNALNSVLTNFNVALNNVVNTYTPHYNAPVTIYTPDTYYRHYLIRHGATGYFVYWFMDNIMFRYVSNMINPSYFKLNVVNNNLLPSGNTYTQTSVSTQNLNCYQSQVYATLEECLQAIQSPNTTYTSTKVNGFSTYYEKEFDGIYTNLPLADNNNFICVKKISNDITIETIS